MTLTIGQEKEIEYTCNIDDAVLSFVCADESVVDVVYRDSKIFAVGKGLGNRTISATAKFGDQKVEREIVVSVLNVGTLPEGPDDESEIEDPIEDNDGQDNEEENDAEEELELNIEAVDGCEVSGNTITMIANTAFVAISAEENIVGELGFEASSGLTIRESKLGSYTYMIEVEETGSYTLRIYSDAKTKEYIINF